MILTRRNFLKSTAAGTVTAGLGSNLFGLNLAQAADLSGYKALVCVFLFGGMDQWDTVYPFDQSTYDTLAQVRSPLFDLYGGARRRDLLLPLTLANQADFGARQFALPAEMTGLRSLFNNGNAAIIGNVGPLIEPTTTQQFLDGSVPLPPRLFSHNDQQSTWQASAPEGAQFGWGGLFADSAIAANASVPREFVTMTTGGNELFLTGELAAPFQISAGGGASFSILEDAANRRSQPGGEEFYQILRRHLRGTDLVETNLIHRDTAAAMRGAVDNNEAYNAARGDEERVSTSFSGDLGLALKEIAETMAVRDALGVSRQVFFVGIGGFDTHSDQATTLPQLQTSIDSGVTSFYNAMVELGIENDVTLFTASDFGRTLPINGDGTDHGWAGHHFVVGGDVQGGRVYGSLPAPELNTNFEAELGRAVPSVSVEEYAAPLGRWFGLNDTELAAALPNLGNFASRASLDYMLNNSSS